MINLLNSSADDKLCFNRSRSTSRAESLLSIDLILSSLRSFGESFVEVLLVEALLVLRAVLLLVFNDELDTLNFGIFAFGARFCAAFACSFLSSIVAGALGSFNVGFGSGVYL